MKEDYLILSVLRRLKTLRRSLGDFDGHLGRSQPVSRVAVATSMDSGHIFARIVFI